MSFDLETVFKTFGCVFQVCKSKCCVLYVSAEGTKGAAVMRLAWGMLQQRTGLAAAPVRDEPHPFSYIWCQQC